MKQTECFGMPSNYQLQLLGSQKPNVHNGTVSVKRYRITVEEIAEPIEVLRGRLVELQGQRLHIDSYAAISAEAKSLGITLPPRF